MPTSSPSIACVLLAAGDSSRFGACKLLADLNGEPVISRTLKTILSSAGDKNPIHYICAVTGAYSETLQPVISNIRADDIPVTNIHCPAWREGMGTSLAFGAKSLPACDAVLVVLADQVILNTADLQALGAEWYADQSKIICARYKNISGVPAIFPAQYRQQLETLSGQSGARKLLANETGIVTIDMPNAAFDIDTPEDLMRAKNLLAGTLP